MILEALLAAASTAHVRVDAPVSIVDSPWVIFAAFASAAAAIGTLVLAAYTRSAADAAAASAEATRELAIETRESIRQAGDAMVAEQNRHMETFQPHIAIIDEFRNVPMPGGPVSQLLTKFKNVGPGYARQIKVHPDKYAVQLLLYEIVQPPVALGPGDEFTYATRPVGAQQKLHGFTISYKDAFGRPFETIVAHPYTPGDGYRWEAPFKTD